MEEIAALAARAEHVLASLVRLSASPRDDWGRAMLVGMARLIALEASVRSRTLVVPDSFDDAAGWVSVEWILAEPAVAAALLRERKDAFETARATLVTAPPSSELPGSTIEVSAGAMLELGDAMRRGTGPVRADPEARIPSRGAEIDVISLMPAVACGELERWAGSAAHATESIRNRLREIYRYDLVSRNCVTELFRTLHTASSDIVLDTSDVSSRSLSFVPFVAAAAVNASYAVSERETLPSYRSHWLAKLREQESPLAVALRESNTLTTTLRHHDERDDVFLFYTDVTPALRPLYGALNAAVGAGATVAGLVAFPLDGGELFRKAIRSFVFSMPELVFISLRKGRNGMLPWDWTHVSATRREPAENRS